MFDCTTVASQFVYATVDLGEGAEDMNDEIQHCVYGGHAHLQDFSN